MQRRVMKDLLNLPLEARDGRIGAVSDVYFDDARWGVRYLVVDTRDWRPGRPVLISPLSLRRDAAARDALPLDLTREQVTHSPGADEHMPVSRQFEEAHARYYGHPFYWDGPYLWGRGPHPVSGDDPVTAPRGRPQQERTRELVQAERQARESHLRSSAELAGYRLVARDGPVGHIEDVVVDDVDWSVSALVADTRSWLPGGQVAVTPDAVELIDWATREVRLKVAREAVKGPSPP